jgi:hypothetical protein
VIHEAGSPIMVIKISRLFYSVYSFHSLVFVSGIINVIIFKIYKIVCACTATCILFKTLRIPGNASFTHIELITTYITEHSLPFKMQTGSSSMPLQEIATGKYTEPIHILSTLSLIYKTHKIYVYLPNDLYQ